ncbi:threonine/serine exporter family protein [Moraxella haemolytica]|uniref:threonine/serine ThrE exporter family protein n=1 Tax=Moraxella haemolytica TaxID=2904119 RepID=UPI0025437928|nr:threonine/serine exporter family protein [Moraxella sp. ZY171148]WII94471.1 threonine/serine exporter family protein [Moraxella sp. ZY171148]
MPIVSESKPRRLPYISYEEQQRITRLCVRCALLFMQYGGESAVVVDLTKRLGVSLGVGGVECALSFNAVTLTTLYNGRCITTARNTIHQGINVSILVQIQQIVMYAESATKNETLIDEVEKQLNSIDRTTYPNALMSLFVGFSCACFAYLNGGNLVIATITLVAGFCTMRIRLYLSAHHFNPFVVVIITAFVATLLGASAYFLDLNGLVSLGDKADIAVAASVLLLVPSFPIINALSDILKGYINMGVGRWMFASMLTLSACVGIVIALILLQIPHWGL